MDWKARSALATITLLIIAALWLVPDSQQKEDKPLPDTTPSPEAPLETNELDNPPSSTPDLTPPPKPLSTPPISKASHLLPPPSTLSDSDSAFYTVVKSLSPSLLKWLTPDEQIRKWVLLVERIADHDIPYNHHPIAIKTASFNVFSIKEKYYADTTNFSRHEPLIDSLINIEPKFIAEYYHHWLPLLETAYAELGRNKRFHDTFHQAIENVIAVKPLSTPAELEQPSVMYSYVNPELENASNLEKFMWRIGPVNAGKIQVYLQQLKHQLQQ